MTTKKLVLMIVVTSAAAMSALAQTTVVVHDPTRNAPAVKLSARDEGIFNSVVLPAVRKRISKDTCDESVEVAGVAHGAFSATGTEQTLIFYQYCQTGNGFGWAGLALIDDNKSKVIGNYLSDGGWTVDIGKVADINQNGLDEFTLAYSGGLHQGQGGTGVDLMEFAGGLPKGLGWYQSEAFGDTDLSTAWKLTAKPGSPPIFYRQRFTSRDSKKWRSVGAAAVYKLGKALGKFEVVK